jgi:hypothetical protein
MSDHFDIKEDFLHIIREIYTGLDIPIPNMDKYNMKDKELIAIDFCVTALSQLNDEQKMRVIDYLHRRFEEHPVKDTQDSIRQQTLNDIFSRHSLGDISPGGMKYAIPF